MTFRTYTERDGQNVQVYDWCSICTCVGWLPMYVCPMKTACSIRSKRTSDEHQKSFISATTEKGLYERKRHYYKQHTDHKRGYARIQAHVQTNHLAAVYVCVHVCMSSSIRMYTNRLVYVWISERAIQKLN